MSSATGASSPPPDLVSGVRVERFDGLIAKIVRRAGLTERALGGVARERIMRDLGGPLEVHAGSTRALGALVAELQAVPARARVSGALRAALRAWAAADPSQMARATQLGTLYEEYERVVGGLGRADSEQRAARALDALRRNPASWRAVPVALYGFDDFTPLQLDAVETLGVLVGARVTVSLAFERGREAFAGRAGTFQTLLPLAAEHRELEARAEYYAAGSRAALHYLERHLFEPTRPRGCRPQGMAGDAVRLLEGGGERPELELVAEEIVALLERGVPAGEIAVAHRTPGAIAELLEEIFTAHGTPYALERRIRFADTALGGALLGVLAVACEADARARAVCCAWLRASGLPAVLEPADQLEARARGRRLHGCRCARVVGGARAGRWSRGAAVRGGGRGARAGPARL